MSEMEDKPKPETGIYYKIVGSADCPRFARTENIARVLENKLNLCKTSIQIEMQHPAKWADYLKETAQQLGFQTHLLETAQRKARCLVWNFKTGRLVGGPKEFRKEVMAKYGLGPSVEWSKCIEIAKENAQLYTQQQSYIKVQEMHQANKKLALIVSGPPCSGKTTQCNLLKKKFGLVVVSPQEILDKHVAKSTVLGKAANMQIEQRLPVSESTLSAMLIEEVSSGDCKTKGWVLDGAPLTQTQALEMESAGIYVDAFIQLSLSDAEIFGRIDKDATPEDKKNTINQLRNHKANITGLTQIYNDELYCVGTSKSTIEVHNDVVNYIKDKVGFEL